MDGLFIVLNFIWLSILVRHDEQFTQNVTNEHMRATCLTIALHAV